jgi:hypothetical protein
MKKPAGIALITTFMLLSVLAIMTLSLVYLSRDQALSSVTYSARRAAQGSAEAGIAHALSEMSQDRGWNTGFSDRPTRWETGTFSCEFGNPAGPYVEGTSINNLEGEAAAHGPDGPNTIPPRTGYLLMEGSARGHKVTIEAFVGDRELPQVKTAVLAESEIEFVGETDIRGLENLDGEKTSGDVHSNQPDGMGIHWVGPTGHLEVEGDLKTTSADSDAIQLESGDSPHQVGTLTTDVDRAEPPDLGIEESIAANMGASDPGPLSSTLNTLAEGKYYKDGDVEVQGDLVLESGVELYVNGNLKVNGSITGQGTVMVDGTTELFGTSIVTSSNRLALLSTGDVELKGFDGTAWLNSLPEAGQVLDDINTVVGDMLPVLDDPTPPSGSWGNNSFLDRSNHELHWIKKPESEPYYPLVPAPDTPQAFPPIYHGDIPQGRIRKLHEIVQAQPSSPTQQFVLEKMLLLDKFVEPRAQAPDPEDFLASPGMDYRGGMDCLTSTGGYDSLTGAERDAARLLLRNIVADFSPDRLGHAYFDGLIYSEGNVRAHSELIVVGSVIAAGGSITTQDRMSVVFVNDYFEPSDDTIKIGGQIVVRAWSIR